ncbi:MAG: D-aminoacyl-tRNA deacylase [Bacteroidota bacterium]
MIALIQRVREAAVRVDGQVTGSIGPGLLILLGIHRHDTARELDWLVGKCARLRIFRDEEGRMNRSVQDVGGGVLVVSQFTLYGDASRGNRPSYIEAAPPEVAEPLYERFVATLGDTLGHAVATGVFGAMMDVHLINDGPVTLWLERRP